MEHKVLQLYNYICYRKYLSDYYEWNKKNTYGFSYRVMAESLGFTSPNFLKLVIDGDRNVGKESLDKITQGIGFNKLETEYFSYLVFFAQAKDTIDKNYYYGLIASLRNNSVISKVAPEQYEYFNEWYYPTIREMIAGRSEPLDYTLLSKEINAKVSVPQVKKAVALLIRLNLIRINEENKYEHVHPLLNTEHEFKKHAIRHYHKQVLSIAQAALDETAPEQRENSHVTIKISRDGFKKVKKRIQDFRDELLQLIAEDQDVSGVYHLNIQLYPVTKCGKNTNEK